MRTFINQFLRPVYKFIRRLFLQFLFSTSYIFFRVCWTALVSGPFIPDLKKNVSLFFVVTTLVTYLSIAEKMYGNCIHAFLNKLLKKIRSSKELIKEHFEGWFIMLKK